MAGAAVKVRRRRQRSRGPHRRFVLGGVDLRVTVARGAG
jgi:hypothetical protein